MSLWHDFGVALAASGTGAGLGSYLGYRLGLRSADVSGTRERRLFLVKTALYESQQLMELAGECVLMKRGGQPIVDQLRSIITHEIVLAQYLNLIGIEHPKWHIDRTLAESDLKISVKIGAWNHAVDPEGNEITDAVTKLLDVFTVIWSAELGDREANLQLESGRA